jgi:hypothetical protein
MSSISSIPGPELELVLVVPPLLAPLVVVPEEDEEVETGRPPSPPAEELDGVPLEVPVEPPLVPLLVVGALEVAPPDVAPPVVLPEEPVVEDAALLLVDTPDEVAEDEEDEVALPDEFVPPSGEVMDRSSIPATISQALATQPALNSNNATRQRFTNTSPDRD